MPQVPLVPRSADFNSEVVGQFLELLRKGVVAPSYTPNPTDPTTTNIPDGTYGVWLNTTSGVLTLWANQSGVLKSTVLT